MFQGSFKGVFKMLQGSLRVFQWCFKVFQDRFREVSRKVPASFKQVSRQFQASLECHKASKSVNGNKCVFQGCFKGVSRLFRVCFKGVSRGF